MPSATQSDVTTPIHTKNSGGRRRIVFRLVIWTYSAKRINAMHVRATVNSIHERLYLVRRIRPIATMAATICSTTEMISRISITISPFS